MTEIRKKLSQVQFRLLMNAQIKHDNALEILKTCKDTLNGIQALVFDAHDIPVGTELELDSQTMELILEESDQTSDSDVEE